MSQTPKEATRQQTEGQCMVGSAYAITSLLLPLLGDTIKLA